MSGMAMSVEFSPLAFEQVTVTTGAQLLTTLSTKPPTARHVMLYPEGEIRMRCDGTAPTEDIGIILDVDLHVFENQLSIINSMKLIASGNTLLNVHWFM